MIMASPIRHQPLKAASGAGLTPLPPSPEIKPSTSQLTDFDPNSSSLNGNVDKNSKAPARLRSIAKYEAFSPQALACSDPVAASFSASIYNNGDNHDDSGRFIGGSQRRLISPSRREVTSSLGAVAGAQGVAVFRVSKPHSPLLMLNHATSSGAAGGGRPVTALAFQPDMTTSLYLAAARGSGVLVWDVSGHSLSPLLGRLAMDTVSPSSSESALETTSLSWKLSTERDGAPLLATTTKNSAAIWDLRSPASLSKPSIRFGVAPRKAASFSSPYAQVACSRSNECALMDAAGIVRIFDIRMTDKTRYSANGLASFTSFVHSGVGISYLPWGDHSSWVTWGLDDPNADAVVKVWTSAVGDSGDTVKNMASDENWYLDGSPGRSTGTITAYRLLAQCSPPYHLACPRVCPDPIENSIMTIGVSDDIRSKRGDESWRADLWKIRSPNSADVIEEGGDGTFGMEALISFNGGSEGSKYIGSVLGKDKNIGRLKAAELAISSFGSHSVLPSPKKGESRDTAHFENDVGLLLCCLSDTGYVTTHMIPEALPKQFSLQTTENGPGSLRGGRMGSNDHGKIFPEENEGGMVDAASIWGTQGDRSKRVSNGLKSTVEMIRNIHSSPVKENPISAAPAPGVLPRASDGGMLFEMDVPAVAYGTVSSGVQIGPIDLASPDTPVATVAGEETENATADIRDVAAMAERMENIETERIPCPPVCGATFGPGIAGLAMFNNGDVRKMWCWYDQTDSTRLSGVPTSITAPEQAFSGLGDSVDAAGVVGQEKNSKASILSQWPRTMKDLMAMTAAAKEAQWGEVNETDAASDDQDQSSSDNFFEYMSTGSLSSDSENEPSEIIGGSGGKGSRLYENYFGNFRRPLVGSSGGAGKKHGDEEQHSLASNTGPSAVSTAKLQVLGPSSDTLAPTVHVTHDFDQLALNNQSSFLAREWELGQWQPEPSMITNVNPPLLSSQRNYFSDPSLEGTRESSNVTGSPPNAGLPSYRRLALSPQRRTSVSRIQSDPVFTKVMQANGAMSKNRMTQIENEPGVHGGEYPVRPNMQESMVFLRKLFSHQQEGNPYPNLMSPPDSPMIHTKYKPAIDFSSIDQHRSKEPSSPYPITDIDVARGSSSSKARLQPGVYALNAEVYGTGVDEDDQKLGQIKEICEHNAQVCANIEETGKAGAWNLLAQMVDRRLNERPDSFNGWGGKGGGALGVDLVGNLMRYYESLGDVQMLATMVCVLSGGRRRSRGYASISRDHLFLLPTGQDEKYDTYIRHYSDLLYGWGLLVKRAELNKHLVQHTQQSEGSIILNDSSNKIRSPGIALVFTCPKCGNDAEFGTNICRTCQDFAFRCSICENGVKGLFIVCDACGHGGHVGHVTTWFVKHAKCPAGCGCYCTFTTHPPVRPTETDGAASGARRLAGPFRLDQLES